MQKTKVDVLCEFANQLQFCDLPFDVIEQTKLFIYDYYVSCIAGYYSNRVLNEIVIDLAESFSGCEQASVILSDKKYPLPSAAYINAIYAHGADIDDGNKKSAGHIAAHVMSAVFAVAEYIQSSWEQVIVAINIGYEFFNRIGEAAQPALYNNKFHSTGVVGAIASAAACAKLLGGDRDSIYHAISIAAIQSSGMIIIDESGQCCKPINAGNAARNGVLSALMAKKGLCGPLNILESVKGWFHVFGNGIPECDYTEGLFSRYTILESYLKLYPSCRHTHCCIDSILELRNQWDFTESKIDDITEINVYIYPHAITSAGKIKKPVSSEEAKFSITYAVAVSLKTGDFQLQNIENIAKDDTIQLIIDKINLKEDCSMENRKENVRGCKVEIVMKDNTILKNVTLLPKGESGNPLTWEDISHKLCSLKRKELNLINEMRICNYYRTIDGNSQFQPFNFLWKG